MRTECRLERPKWLSFHTKPHETPQSPQTRPYPGPQPGETRTPVLGYGFSGVRVRVAPENPRVTRADLYSTHGCPNSASSCRYRHACSKCKQRGHGGFECEAGKGK